MKEAVAKAPASPAGPSPLRRPGSIRRTMSLDTDWPEGMGRPSRLRGRARDIFTPAAGAAPVLLGEDWVEIAASPLREIAAIQACRDNDAAQRVIGLRAGGHMRRALEREMPAEAANATPLHLLLDDFAGASLVANWAWLRWADGWPERRQEPATPRTGGRNGRMDGVCAGFRPGSRALLPDGTPDLHLQNSMPVPPLPHPRDPEGWHPLAGQDGPGMRRARRLDVWLDGVLHMDVGFQDSSSSPAGEDRIAIHEYRVRATADPVSLELLSVEADPRILPYGECPAAASNTSCLIGVPLAGMRREVLERLPGTLGCTHLNDVLRSLADVPRLAARLGEMTAVPPARRGLG